MGRLSLWEVKWHVRPWPSSLHCPAQCPSVLTLEQHYLHSTKRKEIGKSILNLFVKCVKTSCPNEAALCSCLMWASRNPSKKWTLTLSKSHVRIWVEKNNILPLRRRWEEAVLSNIKSKLLLGSCPFLLSVHLHFLTHPPSLPRISVHVERPFSPAGIRNCFWLAVTGGCLGKKRNFGARSVRSLKDPTKWGLGLEALFWLKPQSHLLAKALSPPDLNSEETGEKVNSDKCRIRL